MALAPKQKGVPCQTSRFSPTSRPGRRHGFRNGQGGPISSEECAAPRSFQARSRWAGHDFPFQGRRLQPRHCCNHRRGVLKAIRSGRSGKSTSARSGHESQDGYERLVPVARTCPGSGHRQRKRTNWPDADLAERIAPPGWTPQRQNRCTPPRARRGRASPRWAGPFVQTCLTRSVSSKKATAFARQIRLPGARHVHCVKSAGTETHRAFWPRPPALHSRKRNLPVRGCQWHHIQRQSPASRSAQERYDRPCHVTVMDRQTGASPPA